MSEFLITIPNTPEVFDILESQCNHLSWFIDTEDMETVTLCLESRKDAIYIKSLCPSVDQ